MNPDHLTPNVIKQVVETVKAQRQMMRDKNAKGIQKAFDCEKEVYDFFTPFYAKIKEEVDNDFEAFMGLCILEYQYGFVGGYIGGATLNSDKDTIIEIK